jgi:hypothetical protein
MPVVIRAIDLLLLHLTNVINFVITDENNSTFILTPCPFKGACTFIHRLITFNLLTNVANVLHRCIIVLLNILRVCLI